MRTHINAILFFLLTLISLCAMFLAPSFALETLKDQSGASKEKKIAYDLPYPGILPDHPLYIFKRMRDGMQLFLTRDHLKKAELALILSDKKVVMAQELIEKEKWDKAIEAMESSEEYFGLILESMKISRRIGAAPGNDFIDVLRLSSEKHAELLAGFYAAAPEEYKTMIEEVIKKNVENYNAIGLR